MGESGLQHSWEKLREVKFSCRLKIIWRQEKQSFTHWGSLNNREVTKLEEHWNVQNTAIIQYVIEDGKRNSMDKLQQGKGQIKDMFVFRAQG